MLVIICYNHKYNNHIDGIFSWVENKNTQYENFMTWKRFLHKWPFVRRVHQSPVDSHRRGPAWEWSNEIHNYEQIIQ